MLQLNLTAFGDDREELMYHLAKLIGQLQEGDDFGRTHALRPDHRGNNVLTTMAKYSIKETSRTSIALLPTAKVVRPDGLARRVG